MEFSNNFNLCITKINYSINWKNFSFWLCIFKKMLSIISKLSLFSKLSIIIPLIVREALILIERISTAKIKRSADKGHPWQIPLSIWKNSLEYPLFVTQLDSLVYIVLTTLLKKGPKWKAVKVWSIKLQSSWSKAFQRLRMLLGSPFPLFLKS